MSAAVTAFTRAGAETAARLCRLLDAHGYAKAGYASGALRPFENLHSHAAALWENYDALVFVGACGIAVRAVAPFVSDKASDRAVVVVDEKCRYAIPILSGHLGGANELAEKIASLTGADAVITTATDINGAFAADTFARSNDLIIGDTKLIKEISARLLDGGKVGFRSDYEAKNIPPYFTRDGEAGIYIGGSDAKPFKITLALKPKNLVIGIGCKKNCEDVTAKAEDFLLRHGTDPKRLRAVATIDIKKNEKGIKELCEKYSVPLITFTANELNAARGDFTASEFVKKTVGTDNVCERALSASSARITVPKTTGGGASFALGEVETKIDFTAERGLEIKYGDTKKYIEE